MAAFSLVSRLRNTHDTRSYRRKVANKLQQNVLVQRLPALLDLPLGFLDSEGIATQLDDTLDLSKYTLLAGLPGSGRRLALGQLALQLLASDAHPTPALVSLPLIDDGRSAPILLLAEHIASLNPRRNATPLPPVEQLAGWLLLVSDLEALPETRQQAWRATLQNAPQQWPDSQVIVTTLPEESNWPGFASLRMATPSTELVDRWLELLAPASKRAALSGALRPSGTLAPLSQRLLEVVLLAATSEHSATPSSRAEVYETALARIYDLDRNNKTQQPILESLQLLAAYNERPKVIVASLVEPTASGDLRFAPPLMGVYLAAYQLVSERAYSLLAELPPASQREVARFCATLTGDPSALLNTLWGAGQPDAETLLTLGACLRERPDTPTAWVLRIIGGLAMLHRKGTPHQSQEANALIQQNRVAITATLDALRTADEARQQLLLQFLRLLPEDMALPYAEFAVYDAATPANIVWHMADMASTYAAPAAPPEPGENRMRWIYLQITQSAEQRASLPEYISSDELHQFARTTIDTSRRLQLATLLLDDAYLPANYRAAGLSLLDQVNQPTALTIIERACADTDPQIRQIALGLLSERDSNRGQLVLSQMATNPEASLEARTNAIAQLLQSYAEQSQALLLRCASDASLPLYGQLLSASGLHATPALAQLASLPEASAEVRSLALARFASRDPEQAKALLARLISDSTTPDVLLQTASEYTAVLGPMAADPLVAACDRTHANPDLNIALIHALGETHSSAALSALRDMASADSLALLEAHIPAPLRTLRTQQALETDELPAPIAAAFAAAVARAATPAERPTVLREFLHEEASRIRAAAAQALATIGGNAACSALMGALLDDTGSSARDALVGAIATLEGSGPALAYLLTSEDHNPMVHWTVVQHLRNHPEGEAIMHQALADATVDTFTRGTLAEALGQRGAISALPLLRQIAAEPNSDLYLRSQAILGLGLLNDPATETVLLRLAADPNEDATLRGMAAEHLPGGLTPEGRHLLRELLRRERLPDLLAVGLLLALGRMHDQESLPLLLRFAQDERAQVAQAALRALADLGDESVAPVLVRVAQNPAAERTTRLRAVGTLLRIGGSGYQPLLRHALEEGTLPLRLQALEHMIEAQASGADLLTLAANTTMPLPLRLRALQAGASHPSAYHTLLAIAANVDDTTELRMRAIHALGSTCTEQVIPQLAALAANAPTAIQIACLHALGQIDSRDAILVLGERAADQHQPAVVETLARTTLLHALIRQSVSEQQREWSQA